MLRSLIVDSVTDVSLKETPFSEGQVITALRGSDINEQLLAIRRLLLQEPNLRRASRVLPVVAESLGNSDLEFKRLCYLYIVQCGESLSGWENDEQAAASGGPAAAISDASTITQAAKQELKTALLLTINAFQKWASERCHITRAWSLRALCAIRIPEANTALSYALQRSVSDGSPFVRLQTIAAATEVVRHDPTQLGFVCRTILSKFLSDIERKESTALPPSLSVQTVVVSGSLFCMLQILSLYPALSDPTVPTLTKCQKFGFAENEDFLDVLHPHCTKVIERLPKLTLEGQIAGCEVLTRYFRMFSPCPEFTPPVGDFKTYIQTVVDIALHCSDSCGVFCVAISTLLKLKQTVLIINELLDTLFHAFALTRASPANPGGGSEILSIFKVLAARFAPRIAGRATTFLPSFRDTPKVRQQKRELLIILAKEKDFPFDDVVSHLMDSARWPVSETAHVQATFHAVAAVCERQDTPEAISRAVQEFIAYFVQPRGEQFVEEALNSLAQFAGRTLAAVKTTDEGSVVAGDVPVGPTIFEQLSQRLMVDLEEAESAVAVATHSTTTDNTVRGAHTGRSRAAVISILLAYHRDASEEAVESMAIELCRAYVIGNPRFCNDLSVMFAIFSFVCTVCSYQCEQNVDWRETSVGKALRSFTTAVVAASEGPQNLFIAQDAMRLFQIVVDKDPYAITAFESRARKKPPQSDIEIYCQALSRCDPTTGCPPTTIVDKLNLLSNTVSDSSYVKLLSAPPPLPFGNPGRIPGRRHVSDADRRAAMQTSRPETSKSATEKSREILDDLELFYRTDNSVFFHAPDAVPEKRESPRGTVMLGEIDDDEDKSMGDSDDDWACIRKTAQSRLT